MPRTLKVDYVVTIEPEDIPFVGNCSAIDPETDAKQEQWIRDQLEAGNELAWCWVRVQAVVANPDSDAFPFTGEDSCGGISYGDRAAFEHDVLTEMRANALADLRANLERAATESVREARKLEKNARKVLARLPKRVRL